MCFVSDLLQHIEYARPVGQQPVPYPTVDWFAHPSPSHPPPLSSPHLPTLTDSLLQWPASLVEVKERKRRNRGKNERSPCKKTSEEMTFKLPKLYVCLACSDVRGISPHSSSPLNSPLPTHRESAVNMSQLLAMDYQKEWLEEREQRAIEKKRQVRMGRERG